MRVVLDANVVVSIGLSAGKPGPFATILANWEAARFVAFASRETREELRDVLSRPKFLRRPELNVAAFLSLSLWVDKAMTAIELPADRPLWHSDPSDNDVLWTAIAARADYLVTGDAGLLALNGTAGVSIITPRAFAEVLASADPLSHGES